MGFIHWEEPKGRAPLQPADISSAPEYSYEIPAKSVSLLKSLLKSSAEERRLAILQLGPQRSATLLAQFMTMALSVQANTRAFIESYLVIECSFTQRQSEDLNLPSIEGALSGLAVAIAPVPKMCDGCAFRIGTMANQSAITSEDAQLAVDDRRRFMCHEHTDDEFNALNVCAGWAAAQQQRKEACQATAMRSPQSSATNASRSIVGVSGAESAATSSSSTRSSAPGEPTAGSASAKTTTNASAAAEPAAKSAQRAARSSVSRAAARAKTAQSIGDRKHD